MMPGKACLVDKENGVALARQECADGRTSGSSTDNENVGGDRHGIFLHSSFGGELCRVLEQVSRCTRPPRASGGLPARRLSRPRQLRPAPLYPPTPRRSPFLVEGHPRAGACRPTASVPAR